MCDRLETIDEYNSRKFNEYVDKYATGIECPRCCSQLLFDGDEILTSFPPRRKVRCSECTYKDTVYA